MADERDYAAHFQAYQKAIAAGNQQAADYIKEQMDAAFNKMGTIHDTQLHNVHGGQAGNDAQGNVVDAPFNTTEENIYGARARDISKQLPEFDNKVLAAELSALREGGGLGRLLPGALHTSAEDLQKQDEEIKPFQEGRWGSKLAGEVLAAPPIARGAAGLTSMLPNAVARTAANVAARTGEGAVQGMATGNPDTPGRDATAGALGSLTLQGAGSLVGKGVRGFVSKLPEIQAIVKRAAQEGRNLFVPVEEGAEGGAARGFYNTLVGKFAGGKVGQQSAQAANDMYALYRDVFDRTLHSWDFNTDTLGTGISYGQRALNGLVRNGVPPQIAEQIAAHSKQILDKYSSTPEVLDQGTGKLVQNGIISGNNMRTALEELEQTAGQQWPQYTRQAVGTLRSLIGDARQDAAQQVKYRPRGQPAQMRARNQQMVNDLDEYSDAANEWYNTAKPFIERIAGAGPRGSGMQGGLPGAALAAFAEHSLTGRPPWGTAAIYGGSQVAGSRALQQTLYGDTGAQKALVDFARQNPAIINLLSSGGRQTGVSGVEDATGQ